MIISSIGVEITLSDTTTQAVWNQVWLSCRRGNPDRSTHRRGMKKHWVVLSGEGEMVIVSGPKLTLRENSVAYCPNQTEQYINNTG
jgi:mannose-6-phosphate isomerase-like protein (cupin superfamily)